MPHLQGAFSAGVDEIAWVVTSYLAANGIMIPMTGWICARFGRKRYFLTSIFVFVAASVLCGTAQWLMQIAIFRLVQGAAGAAMVPPSQAILIETFPAEERQMAMELWGTGVSGLPFLRRGENGRNWPADPHLNFLTRPSWRSRARSRFSA